MVSIVSAWIVHPRVRFVLVFEIGLSGFLFCNGEFDPGSGRTLAACLIHASRTLKEELASLDELRTGE